MKKRSELEGNNKHLKLTLNTIQQREQMETTAKFQDIEQENKRLQDRMEEMIQQISQLQVHFSSLIRSPFYNLGFTSGRFSNTREHLFLGIGIL